MVKHRAPGPSRIPQQKKPADFFPVECGSTQHANRRAASNYVTPLYPKAIPIPQKTSNIRRSRLAMQTATGESSSIRQAEDRLYIHPRL